MVGKRNRQAAKSSAHSSDSDQLAGGADAKPPTVHPPARRPALLVVSILLFAAWLVFLLVTALRG
jgi:hypothetical protein